MTQPDGSRCQGRFVIDLHRLAEYVHLIAINHALFDVPDWDENFIPKIAFAITELDEGVQWVEGIGKDPVEIELADTAIRLMSTLYGIWGNDWSAGRILNRVRPNQIGLFMPLEVAVWPVLRQICKAMECWRKNDPATGKKDAMICIELAVLETFRVADRMGFDLIKEIERKAAKNTMREPLHGKGRSVG